MSFRQTVAELKTPKIYTLALTNSEGKLIIKGLRVKVCKAMRGRGAVPVIQYYDFVSKIVTDREVQSFLQQNMQNFERLELLKEEETANEEVYVTQEEKDGTVRPQEFVDSNDANKVLRVVMDYYNQNK